MAHEPILPAIEQFLAATGIGASYFGQKAVGNSKLVKRLRSGRPIESGTEERLRAFMAAEMAERRRRARRVLARSDEMGAEA